MLKEIAKIAAILIPALVREAVRSGKKRVSKLREEMKKK